MIKINQVYGACVILALFLGSFGCSSAARANLDPESEAFLSSVRYIITKDEKKDFLNLPPSERPAFIEEFWKRRDPSPETEFNEYRKMYYQRIEEANSLFRDGLGEGWLQDRGRIYILLGPPDSRQQYPRGYTMYDLPTEVWMYGFYSIIFVDQDWNGNFELVKGGAYNLAQIMRTQMAWKPKVSRDKVVFDTSGDIEVFKEGDRQRILVKIPYRNIWMKAEGENLETTIIVEIQITNAENQEKVWEFKKDYDISVKESELEKMYDEDYKIDVPVELQEGSYTIDVFLENATDAKKIAKSLKFRL
ncbi:MAG: GWxTD domain-containing protein [Candidatus Aminicenantes bacterium]|jgi:GWxTD domain-containing protein